MVRSICLLVTALLILPAAEASAQTLTTLYNLNGPIDGSTPHGLVLGSDGNFYGTTEGGGLNGSGTVFRVTTAGTFTALYHFGGPDGSQPKACLIQALDDSFYGTTYYGGTNGLGTVFRITSNGTLTVVYQFSGSDGAYLDQALVQGNDGNFYGSTIGGGTNIISGSHTNSFGTVFKLTPAGTLTTLRRFVPGPDGRYPEGLVASGDGAFYGTTRDSTIFRIDPSGTFTTIWTATVLGDPSLFVSPLTQGSDGHFCGLGWDGGATGWGAIFKFDPSSSPPGVTNLYSFDCDFCSPWTTILHEASDGGFYGTTWGGGTSTNCVWGCGMAFRVAPAGGLTPLWSFTNGLDGAKSFSGLVQDSTGDLYGTTSFGGSNAYGTIFRVSIPLNPPANQISRISGAAQMSVAIPSVAGETYQLQYTDSLNPTNWSNTGSAVISIGGPLILIDNPPASVQQRFYRAVITP